MSEAISDPKVTERAEEIVDHFSGTHPTVRMSCHEWLDLKETIERHLQGLEL
jgi:hypothetical protein